MIDRFALFLFLTSRRTLAPGYSASRTPSAASRRFRQSRRSSVDRACWVRNTAWVPSSGPLSITGFVTAHDDAPDCSEAGNGPCSIRHRNLSDTQWIRSPPSPWTSLSIRAGSTSCYCRPCTCCAVPYAATSAPRAWISFSYHPIRTWWTRSRLCRRYRAESAGRREGTPARDHSYLGSARAS